MMNASAFSTRTPPDQCFIYFDMLTRMPPDAILLWANHTGSQLVKNAESRLIARQPKLPLELSGRYPLRMGSR